ncbi:MAG: hypothetical protein AB1576_14275 [Bacillota bacterium]
MDGIYLKSVNWAYALAYVFLLALLIATYLERRVRVTLAARNDTIKLPGKRVVNKPTVASLLELLRSFQVILVDTGNGTLRVLPSNTNPEVLKALRLAGFSEDIYLK